MLNFELAQRAAVGLLLVAGSFGSTGFAATPSDPVGVRVPAHERYQLANGLTVVLLPKPDVPLIAFAAVVRGGGLVDPVGKAGAASLTAGLLEKGAGKRSAFEFADAVAGVGGSFNAAPGTEAITVGGQFLSRDRALMLELLADALQRPRLEATEFEKLREREIELIKAAKDSDPSSLTTAYGRAFLFGEHPYARPLAGSERSLAQVTHQDVLDYHRSQFGADRTTLIFTGDIDSAWLKRAVVATFGRWQRATGATPELTAAPRVSGRRVLLVDSPGSIQAYFWVGNVGVDRRYAGRPALDLVNTFYGGRFTSILNTELRVKSGLSYGANSSFTRGTVPGEFAIRSFVLTENTGKALDMALRTLEDLKRGEVAPDTLASARAYVLGQFPLRLETASHWAAAMAELELYRLPVSQIDSYGRDVQAVDAAATQRVIADAFPATTDLAIVIIGDAAKLRDEVKRFGPVTEMSITATDFAPR
jgi:predicted Zn-dependent peptidase